MFEQFAATEWGLNTLHYAQSGGANRHGDFAASFAPAKFFCKPV